MVGSQKSSRRHGNVDDDWSSDVLLPQFIFIFQVKCLSRRHLTQPGRSDEASAASACRFRQIVLGGAAATLAAMETGPDSRPAGDRCSMASKRIQVVLDLALAAPEPGRKKVCEPGTARTRLPHGC